MLDARSQAAATPRPPPPPPRARGPDTRSLAGESATLVRCARACGPGGSRSTGTREWIRTTTAYGPPQAATGSPGSPIPMATRCLSLSSPDRPSVDHVRAQGRDAAQAQFGEHALAQDVLLVLVEGVDGGPVAGPEHHVPESRWAGQIVPGGNRLHFHVQYPGARTQIGQGFRRGDLVPGGERLVPRPL